MKVTSLFSKFDQHDVFFASGSGVEVNLGLFLRGDADAMERLAKAASDSARIQRSQAQLPGCDGSQMPAPERQPRERGVKCARCGRETWTVDAICSSCAERHCQHCADPVLSVEGGLIHTTNGTVHCDEPRSGPTTEAA